MSKQDHDKPYQHPANSIFKFDLEKHDEKVVSAQEAAKIQMDRRQFSREVESTFQNWKKRLVGKPKTNAAINEAVNDLEQRIHSIARRHGFANWMQATSQIIEMVRLQLHKQPVFDPSTGKLKPVKRMKSKKLWKP